MFLGSVMSLTKSYIFTAFRWDPVSAKVNKISICTPRTPAQTAAFPLPVFPDPAQKEGDVCLSARWADRGTQVQEGMGIPSSQISLY